MGKEDYYSFPEILEKLRLSANLLALELSQIFTSISLNLNHSSANLPRNYYFNNYALV